MRALATGVVCAAVVLVTTLSAASCGAPSAAEIDAARKAAVKATANAAAVDSARKELAEVEGQPAGLAISAVMPEQLALSGDVIGAQTLTVTYQIPDAASVTKAELKLQVGEIGGDIATKDVPVAEHGTADVAIVPGSYAIGPTVRLRAVCATGTTDWYTLGQIPYDYAERMKPLFRIANVLPVSITATPAMMDAQNQPAAGATITLFGPGLPLDCRIEGQSNGAAIEIHNQHYLDKAYHGLIAYRDIGSTTVSPRYAELKLLITRGNGQRLEVAKRIAFGE